MAAQNDEKPSNTGIENKGRFNNYGSLNAIGVQYNIFVNNLYHSLELEKDDRDCPYKGLSRFIPRDY